MHFNSTMLWIFSVLRGSSGPKIGSSFLSHTNVETFIIFTISLSHYETDRLGYIRGHESSITVMKKLVIR
jgi:hypothetical protein